MGVGLLLQHTQQWCVPSALCLPQTVEHTNLLSAAHMTNSGAVAGVLNGTANHPSFEMAGELEIWEDEQLLELGRAQWARLTSAAL